MTQTTVTTIETTIEHLDFEAELPCEVRWLFTRCCTSTGPLPAELRVTERCPHCGATATQLVCGQCWDRLLAVESWSCRRCHAELGHFSNFATAHPLNT